MNGAESLVRSLLNCGVNTCFANPGTSEMHFVAALDRVPGMRCVPSLFEGVATGAADGYGRMLDKPAATLLHLGPGLANGLANLHNARRAGTPVVNIVGEHASWHLTADAPLHTDIAALAGPMSRWVHTSAGSLQLGQDAVDAVHASMAKGGQVATLIAPADAAWQPGAVGGKLEPPTCAPAPAEAIGAAARALLAPGRSMLMVGGRALRAPALEVAARISALTGARLACPTSNARIERGSGRAAVERMPYPLSRAMAFMQGVERLILVGARAPVAFFGYPDGPSSLVPPGCQVIELANTDCDLLATLELLAQRLDARTAPLHPASTAPAEGEPRWDPDGIMRTVAGLLPDQAILVDEALTSGHTLFQHTVHAAPHDHLQLTGGAIGMGLPVATGAAVACPSRKVISLEGDGSGMYTAQALWTQARERLNVLTLVFANRGYQILRGEMAGMGVSTLGPQASRMLDIEDPELDWVGLANAMGVEAATASSIAQLRGLMQSALAKSGPFLIEVRLNR